MKPRGIAFAVESISNLPASGEYEFQRLENVVLTQIKEFIPHFLVKISVSFNKKGFGSDILYKKLFENILPQLNLLGFTDLLRFFEVKYHHS